MIDYKKVLAKRHRIAETEIKFILVEAAPVIIKMLDRTNAGHAEKYFKRNGIEIHTASSITKVNPDSVEIKDHDPIATQTLIWTAGVKTNHIADEFGIEAGRGGRLITNQYLQAKGVEDQSIYVAGDNANATEEGAERAVPQTAQEAENEAVITAHNMAEDINGTTNYQAFTDKNKGFTVSFGAHYGIAQVFNDRRIRGWVATVMKHFTNYMYFWKIRSGYAMWKYAMDEFFRVQNGRTVFGDDTARNANVLWTLPLRLFFGLALFLDGRSNLSGTAGWLSAMSPTLGTIELILGVLIFIGLATWCASFLVILGFLIFVHTWPAVWILFAAFALLNGSGRSVGLDYWFVPWLQKTWSRSRYGTPRSIYHQ